MVTLPFLDPLNEYHSAELITPALPEPVSLLPQTSGWLWLCVLLLLIAGKVWLMHKAKQLQDTWRIEALSIIEQAASKNELSGLYSLLLRIAKLSIPKDELGSLSAEQVLERLNLNLTSSQRDHLLAARYRPAGTVVDDSLFPVLKEWVKMYSHA